MLTSSWKTIGIALFVTLLTISCGRQPTAQNPQVPERQNLVPPVQDVAAPGVAPGTHRVETAVETPVVHRRPSAIPHNNVTSSHRPHYVTRKRSKKRSAAIVGGSAAAGAAIGALAGGGKGAAIGAISGGAAGLVYDRSTATKRKRID